MLYISKLPKTDNSRSPSSPWYNHEWVAGIPVVPNLSRPPIRNRRFFEKTEATRQRFLTSTPENSFFLNGSGLSPVPVYEQVVWYKRIIYTITTVLVTITTTVINTTIRKQDSLNHVSQNHLNGNKSITREKLHKEESWFKSIFKSIFSRIVTTYGLLSYAVVAPFYAFYRTMANVEAYILNVFSKVFCLTTARRRFWALILLLIVPYLILFGMGFVGKGSEKVNNTIPVIAEATNKIASASFGWSSISAPLTAAYISIASMLDKLQTTFSTSDDHLSVPQHTASADSVIVSTSADSVVPPSTNKQSQRETIIEKIVYQEKDVDMGALLEKEKDKIVAMLVPQIESIQMEKYRHVTSNEIKDLQMQLDQLSKQQANQDASFIKQRDDVTALFNELKLLYGSMQTQAQDNQEAQRMQFERRLLDLQASLDASLTNQQAETGAKYEELQALLSKLQLQKKDSQQKVYSTVDFTENTEYLTAIQQQLLINSEVDRLGLPDYALSSGGGYVLSTRCTKSVTLETAYHLLGFDIPWFITSDPLNVLKPSVHPGECWCFVGSEGHLIVKLFANITVTSVTLEHAHKSILPPGAFASAPYKFTIIGLDSPTDVNGTSLGTFMYEDNGNSLQNFVTIPTSRMYNIIELYVLSNHGADHTCIYRFRIHGDPEPVD